jgi:hypothetical protein
MDKTLDKSIDTLFIVYNFFQQIAYIERYVPFQYDSNCLLTNY